VAHRLAGALCLRLDDHRSPRRKFFRPPPAQCAAQKKKPWRVTDAGAGGARDAHSTRNSKKSVLKFCVAGPMDHLSGSGPTRSTSPSSGAVTMSLSLSSYSRWASLSRPGFCRARQPDANRPELPREAARRRRWDQRRRLSALESTSGNGPFHLAVGPSAFGGLPGTATLLPPRCLKRREV